MVAQYDSKLLQQYADRLYSQAQGMAVTTSFFWAIVGFAVGYAAGSFMSRGSATSAAMFVALVGGAVGAIAGAYKGWQKSFQLRFQAQQTLCQMHIEANTRDIEANTRARNGEA